MKLSRLVMLAAIVAALAGLTGARPAAAQDAAAVTESPAANLRIELITLLTQHADLAVPVLEKRYDGAPDFEAANAALDMNSQMVAAMVRAVYGDAAAAQFLALWREHIGYYIQFTDGAKARDNEAMTEAREGLRSFVERISTLLASANPNLSQQVVEDSYQIHVDQTLAAVDAYGAGEYARLYTIAGEAHMHIAFVATTLADAIAKQFPQRFPGDAGAPAVDLRAMLVTALTEFTSLTALATQKAYDGAPDAPAVLDALGENAERVTAMVRMLYGDAAADAFLQRWQGLIDGAATYALALKANNAAGLQAAQARLSASVAEITALLAGANPFLPAPAAQSLLATHVQLLGGAIDAYAAGDYPTTYMRADAATMQAMRVGTALATSIANQFPQRFLLSQSPLRLPNTGDGSCDDGACCTTDEEC